MNKNPLLSAVLLGLLSLSQHANAVQINWASAASANAANAAGPPDGVIVTGSAGTSSFGGFGVGPSNLSSYSLASLATFLNVTQTQLALADFIAFEGNGTAGITFESSAWTFSDGTNTLTVNHTFGNTPGQDSPSGTVLALGNVTLSSYQSFFGTPTTPAQGDFAYILFDISSSVNTSASTFGASMVAPGDGAKPGTPDIDALGTLAVPEPDTVALTGIGLLILSLGRRYFRKLRPREIS